MRHECCAFNVMGVRVWIWISKIMDSIRTLESDISLVAALAHQNQAKGRGELACEIEAIPKRPSSASYLDAAKIVHTT